MSKRKQNDSLKDIVEAIQRIESYIAEYNKESFLEDSKTQDAVIRNLEIVGEATKNISSTFRLANAKIPWKNMAGLRDRLIHDYFGVNLDIVWEIASSELGSVKLEIVQILENE